MCGSACFAGWPYNFFCLRVLMIRAEDCSRFAIYPSPEMSSTIQHLSHPEHELILKENDVIEETATCRLCNKTVIGFPTYTCTCHGDEDIQCKFFYLHRTCAELPTEIYPHEKHNRHPLTLQLRPDPCNCNVCGHKVKFAYACEDCNFDLCVACAFPRPSVDEHKVLRHEGHLEHPLILQRQALFHCDACWEEAKDYSYVCFTCDFWIHKKCAFSSLIIPDPSYHHHPLHLIYSIPDIHRYFVRLCNICDDPVHVHSWMYYCHKCTYFVHIKCASSTASTLNETEATSSDNDPDLIEFPLHSEEALFDLITTQCSKFQDDFKGEHKDTITISTKPTDQHIIEEHWSHPNHPLEQFQFMINDNDSDEEDYDSTTVLICDGCILPITVCHPSYYGCTQCSFFLHSVCATKLPQELPTGLSSSHPQHSLTLSKNFTFYKLLQCGVCGCATNGFYYECETCDIKIDICCAFLPSRIKYKSHKHHPLIQRPSPGNLCSVNKFRINVADMEYVCEICSDFRISIISVFYPSTMKHKYDDHPLTLRYPPFFYEGVFYCELCEEPVNNQWWLYHCGESDHSFHSYCLHMADRVKFGGTIILDIDDEIHRLAYVHKRNVRTNSPLYICGNCGGGFPSARFFECDGCGYLICIKCVTVIYGD